MGKGKERGEGQGKKPLTGRKAGGPASDAGSDVCRCKEVAGKTPRGLLKLMISDLAFWKKKKPLV